MRAGRRRRHRDHRVRPRRRSATSATARSCPTRRSTSCAAFDAILLGAVGTPEVPPGVIERGLLLKMRFELDLYVNQRPFVGTARADRAARLRRHPREHRGPVRRRGRRAAQGHAARGRDAGQRQHPDGRRALRPLRVRAGRAAGERKHLTLVHKTNVLTFAGDLWQRTFDEVAAEFPDVATAYNHVDAASHLLRPGPAALRRHRHRQPVRRHPHRPRRRRVAAASAWRRRPTSTRPAPARRCSSRCTARRPTSPAPGMANPTAAILSARADARLPRRGATPPSGSARRAPSRSAGSTTRHR